MVFMNVLGQAADSTVDGSSNRAHQDRYSGNERESESRGLQEKWALEHSRFEIRTGNGWDGIMEWLAPVTRWPNRHDEMAGRIHVRHTTQGWHKQSHSAPAGPIQLSEAPFQLPLETQPP